MSEMNTSTEFGRLVVGEQFSLPGSTVLLIKETVREVPEFGLANASYGNPHRGQPVYFPDDTSVMRRPVNKAKEVRLKYQPFQYQCIQCQKWVEESDAAMSKEGVMCLDCYALTLKSKQPGDESLSLLVSRLYPDQQ